MDALRGPWRLLTDLAASQGWTIDEGTEPLGLEITLGERKARLLAHEDEALAIFEIDVAVVPEDRLLSPDFLLALHQVNHQARFVHSWTAVIDDTDMLVISRTVLAEPVPASQLLGWIEDGLDRVEALEALVRAEPVAVSATAPAADRVDTLMRV